MLHKFVWSHILQFYLWELSEYWGKSLLNTHGINLILLHWKAADHQCADIPFFETGLLTSTRRYTSPAARFMDTLICRCAQTKLLMHFLQTALNCERTRFAITFNRNAIRQLGMLWPLDRCRDPHRHSCRTQLNRIFSHQRRFQMPDQSVWERTLCYKSEQCVPLHKAKWFNGLDMLVGLSNNEKSETSGPALSLKRLHSQAVNTATTCCGRCHETHKQTKQTKLKMETEWLVCHFFLV